MNLGWVKLHRKFTSWEWYQDSKMVHLFLHLLLMANSKDGRWQGVDLKRGQVIIGRKKLSKLLEISERSVRTCLRRLEKSGETTSKTTNKFTILTICNYEEYQSQQTDKRPAERPTTDQQTTSKRPANDHKQEVKKLRSKEHVQNITNFDLFWESYPVKKNKKKARQTWVSRNLGNGLFTKIMSSLDAFKKSTDWTKDNGQYIPMPTTWLNGDRWEDDTTKNEESEWV